MSAEPQLFRINPDNRESAKISEVEFSQLGFRERRDIQEWIAANPGILDDDLLIIGKEFSGFDKVNERLDLLAVDKDGNLVIIELKRDHSGSDVHWQAIKYASYLRHATKEHIIHMLTEYLRKSESDAEKKVSESDATRMLVEHLDDDDLNSLNNDQRIILASHRFAPEVTSASLWLNEKAQDAGLITCIQLIPYRDTQTDSLYIQTNTIIPIPGEEELSITIGETSVKPPSGRGRKPHSKDGITQFLRKTAEIASSGLPEHIRPSQRSRLASGGADDRVVKGVFRRFYHVWYANSSLWGNWDTSYRINLYPDPKSEGPKDIGSQDAYTMNLYPNTQSGAWELGPWIASIELAKLPEELVNRIAESAPGDGLVAKGDRLYGTYTSNALDDEFAKTLAGVLQRFIEKATPIVNQFEDERTNQENA